MIVSIPDSLNTSTSEKYLMSIRLRPDGLSFSAYDPGEGQSFFYRELSFDPALPYIDSLKESFFDNECFAWNYKRTDLLCANSPYIVVPAWLAEKTEWHRLLDFAYISPSSRCLDNPLEEAGAEVLFTLDEAVYEFCARSLANPVFTHSLTPELIMLGKQAMGLPAGRHLFAVIDRHGVDLLCFNASKLLFANTFAYEQAEDILYYLLYAWQQLQLDQLGDTLSLSGETALCSQLTETLRLYIRQISPVDIPSKAYLLGGEIMQAPLDQILFTVCE
ncbi:MAG: DUF3822 family protein [Tannerella sp.]|jgi:hypothetical protein|nr:DUF3822 family protein [Tannerella sp.]